MLFNEPKLLKFDRQQLVNSARDRFSALQRAEIAEIGSRVERKGRTIWCFSALQRAEIAEIGFVVHS